MKWFDSWPIDDNPLLRTTECTSVELKYGIIDIQVGIKDHFGPLVFKFSNFEIADLPYIYRLNGKYCTPEYTDHHISENDKEIKLDLIGNIDHIQIIHSLLIKKSGNLLQEFIQICNTGTAVAEFRNLDFGFACSLQNEDAKWSSKSMETKFSAIPFRREIRRGKNAQYEDFSPKQAFEIPGGYAVEWRWKSPRTPSFDRASEGWLWSLGNEGLVIIKYNPNDIEHSKISPFNYFLSLSDYGEYDLRGFRYALRFGGAGLWAGQPETAIKLKPGETYSFGLTQYQRFTSTLQDGYKCFKNFMSEMGHGIPAKYNPLIHWNELYDNPLWWHGDPMDDETYPLRKKHYSRELILKEAQKASEIGCEALYLDPGWDTMMGSSVWDETRLGNLEEFVQELQKKYSLRLALHNTFGMWTDSRAFPEGARRVDHNSKIVDGLMATCPGADEYIELQAQRIIQLAKSGVYFVMFDGTTYTGLCFNAHHGHTVPYSRSAHLNALQKLLLMIRKNATDLLMEVHDPLLGGDQRPCPCYFIQGANSFQELWAFEYMWEPLEDLLSGRAISLYYYNLAYDIPLYLHIDLRKDNHNALAFWWYASTCRHLGVGGQITDDDSWAGHNKQMERYRQDIQASYTMPARKPDGRLWSIHKTAMKLYKEYKEFFVHGEFIGIDEMCHVHLLKDRGVVLVIFNLNDKRKKRMIEIPLSLIGATSKVNIECEVERPCLTAGKLILEAEVPETGVKIIPIRFVN